MTAIRGAEQLAYHSSNMLASINHWSSSSKQLKEQKNLFKILGKHYCDGKQKWILIEEEEKRDEHKTGKIICVNCAPTADIFEDEMSLIIVNLPYHFHFEQGGIISICVSTGEM